MLKLRRLAGVGLLIGAALAVSAGPVLAQTTSVKGTLSGTEYSVEPGCTAAGSCTAYLAGYFSANTRGYSGFWNVGVTYSLPSSSSPGWSTTTPFTLSTSRGTFIASVSDGTITAGQPQSFFGFCAQPYELSGSGTPTTASATWSNVDFQGELTDYGIESTGGTCTDVFFATVGGSLTFMAG